MIACVATYVIATYLSLVIVQKDWVYFTEKCDKSGKSALLETGF